MPARPLNTLIAMVVIVRDSFREGEKCQQPKLEDFRSAAWGRDHSVHVAVFGARARGCCRVGVLGR